MMSFISDKKEYQDWLVSIVQGYFSSSKIFIENQELNLYFILLMPQNENEFIFLDFVIHLKELYSYRIFFHCFYDFIDEQKLTNIMKNGKKVLIYNSVESSQDLKGFVQQFEYQIMELTEENKNLKYLLMNKKLPKITSQHIYNELID